MLWTRAKDRWTEEMELPGRRSGRRSQRRLMDLRRIENVGVRAKQAKDMPRTQIIQCCNPGRGGGKLKKGLCDDDDEYILFIGASKTL